MSYPINNQPYINLEPFVNINSLIDQLPRFNYAIVKSAHLATPSKYYGQSFFAKDQIGLLDAIPEYLNKYQNQFDFIQDLKDTDLLGAWLRYQYPIAYGQSSIPIIYSDDYFNKHKDKSSHVTSVTSYYDFFFNWLQSENIFSEIGRVTAFINEPGAKTPTHRDYPDGVSRKDEFIWINLDGRKKFYVYDSDLNVTHYITSKIVIFDNSSWHGCDTAEFATWSIRVDGTFTDMFLDKTNMYNHYRTNVNRPNWSNQID